TPRLRWQRYAWPAALVVGGFSIDLLLPSLLAASAPGRFSRTSTGYLRAGVLVLLLAVGVLVATTDASSSSPGRAAVGCTNTIRLQIALVERATEFMHPTRREPRRGSHHCVRRLDASSTSTWLGSHSGS